MTRIGNGSGNEAGRCYNEAPPGTRPAMLVPSSFPRARRVVAPGCRPRFRVLATLAATLLAATTASAQLVPNAEYRTLETPHFCVHYTRDLDSLARRAAVSAERAYARLARELVPPRGPLDLVVADNVDYSNGYATPFPTNRMVVYATPPVEGALRNYADWLDLVVTHELVHVFHLDRTRGIWRLGQRVFGRNPALFPNTYSPSWLTEGLAVYYETRLTGSGRLAGTAHRVQALAAAAGGASPRLDQLSGATPAFPGGSTAYVWGSLAVEQLAASSDSMGVRRFIDATARQLVPFRLNRAARGAFGTSFTAAWSGWRDSVAGIAGALRTDSSWRFIGGPAWDAAAPRWTGDGTTVSWPATFPREVPALWIADTAGRLRRAGRRNTLDVNAPRPGGGFVYGQLDFVDPFRVRADLWAVDADGDRRRLTRGARLLQPDVRADGRIVAVQIVGGTTRLVQLSERDPRVVALTTTHADTQWSEPRWGGEQGSEIAAIRRVRGGRAEVVRLDTTGLATVVSASDRVEASPSWHGTGCDLWSVSDRGGQPLPVTSAAPCGGAGTVLVALVGIAPGTAGVVALDANRAASRDSALLHRLAAVGIGARGYRLMTRRLDWSATPGTTLPARGDSLDAARLALADTLGQGAALGRTSDYSPWRLLVPRWWLPLLDETELGTTMLGGYSSGSDIVGRHLWGAELLVPVRHSEEIEGALTWRYRGLGQPAIDLGFVQQWLRDTLRLTDPETGAAARYRVARAERTASLGLSIVRPRIYTSASLSAGGEIEWFDPLRTEPRTRVGQLNPVLFRRRSIPGAYVSAAWSALQRAPQAVSPEDGVSVGATYRERWQRDFGRANGRWAIGTLRAYKSVPLPGYAKHVLAARGSAGWANAASTMDFDAGGTSGASLEALPGLAIGDASRAFGVRGFSPGTLSGNRAAGGTLEYRAPLRLANRGLGVSPLYLARTGVTLFGDGATAWCGDVSALFVCRSGATPRTLLASVGAELWLDASATYDIPYRVRLGLASPVRERARSRVAEQPVPLLTYFSFGASF